MYSSEVIQITVFAFCDFIAQSILVPTTSNAHHLLHSSTNCSKDILLLDCVGLQHSCCDCSLFLRIEILGPSIHSHPLTYFNLCFLALWIVQGAAPMQLTQGQLETAPWSDILALTGLTLSMTVNALVTGLIVFRIFKVFQEVKTGTADDQILGVTGGTKLRRVILIEPGMALFVGILESCASMHNVPSHPFLAPLIVSLVV